MYKKTIMIGTLLIVTGCTSDLADKLGTAAMDGLKSGLTGNSSDTENTTDESFSDKLMSSLKSGLSAGLTGDSTGSGSTVNSNKLTKEEYISKCTRIYSHKYPTTEDTKELCTKLSTMNSSSRCIMELQIKHNADIDQAGDACASRVNTYFLRERKGKETFKSCMEDNDWRLAGVGGLNGLNEARSICKEKLRKKDSKYID